MSAAPARFELPVALEATEPPEARGLRRDGIRLMVCRKSDPCRVEHRYFADLATLLEPGDVLAVNVSATLPARLDATVGTDRRPAALHLSARLSGGDGEHGEDVVVELRHRDASGTTSPWLDARPGTIVDLPGGAAARLERAFTPTPGRAHVRLWEARLTGTGLLLAYLARHGRPIRYSYVPAEWPISSYQTVFADVPGSAEMPSAARPFSTEVTTKLVARGVTFAPFVLHCGVSSLEAHEPPAPERFKVPESTAALINGAHDRGHRVVAVGTTAVRALETVAGRGGRIRAAEGWTDLVITADRPVRAVDGLITGWHEPGASHLALLQAVAGQELVACSYRTALAEGYLWHEFGDSQLVLP